MCKREGVSWHGAELQVARIQGDLLDRSYAFAIMIFQLVDHLPNNAKGWIVGRQLIRSGAAVGAILREANHAFSNFDFAYKCNLSLKEAAEAQYWLQLCRDAGLLEGIEMARAMDSAAALQRILCTVVKRTQVKAKREF